MRTIAVWKQCAPVASCPWLHADSNNVIFAWLQIAGSSGNDWARATGLLPVDRIYYPHLLFIVIGLTPGIDVGVGQDILGLKMLLFLCICLDLKVSSKRCIALSQAFM